MFRTKTRDPLDLLTQPLQAALTSLAEGIRELTGEVGYVRGQIASLRDQNAVLTESVNSVASELAVLTASVTDLRKEVTEASTATQ